MRVLIIHHLEEEWNESYKRYGTSFSKEAAKVVDHIDENDYDLVILTRFEQDELGEEHLWHGLDSLVDKVYAYGYSWERDMIPDFPHNQKWCDGGYHSEIVLIEDWMEELKGHEVDLCGAFDGQCIEDMEFALSHVGVEFNRIEELIV